MNTPYTELSHAEMQSDIEQADKIIYVIATGTKKKEGTI